MGAEVETLKGECEKCAEGTQCSSPLPLSVSSRVCMSMTWHTDPHHSGITLLMPNFEAKQVKMITQKEQKQKQSNDKNTLTKFDDFSRF